MKLIDERTADGSRCFARLAHNGNWDDVRRTLLVLSDIELTLVPSLESRRGTLGFRFRGHQFLVTHRQQELCLVVCDPLCSDLLLYQVARHLEESASA